MPDILPVRIRTINALISGYSSCAPGKILEPLAEDFTHHVLPARMGMPVRDRSSFAQHAAGIFAVFDEFRMIPKNMYEDEKRGIIILHARMKGVLKRDRSSWVHECIMFIKLNAEGSQVVQIHEFVDSAKAIEMRDRVVPEYFGMAMDDPWWWVMDFKTIMWYSLTVSAYFGAKRFIRKKGWF